MPPLPPPKRTLRFILRELNATRKTLEEAEAHIRETREFMHDLCDEMSEILGKEDNDRS